MFFLTLGSIDPLVKPYRLMMSVWQSAAQSGEMRIFWSSNFSIFSISFLCLSLCANESKSRSLPKQSIFSIASETRLISFFKRKTKYLYLICSTQIWGKMLKIKIYNFLNILNQRLSNAFVEIMKWSTDLRLQCGMHLISGALSVHFPGASL